MTTIDFPINDADNHMYETVEAFTKATGVEIKVINEYRLNFVAPEHRAMLQKACLEFLNVPA